MSRRSLWPREHGAYFQLAIPLLTACLLRVPTLAMGALALAAALAFLANEPLLVVLGHRGPRMREDDGGRARWRLGLLAGGALALGTAGLLFAPVVTLPAAALVGLPAAALLGFAWRRAEHTMAGELVAAIALAGASVPVLVAGGSGLTVALAMWLGWSVGFGATVVAVHRVIVRHRSPASWIDRVLAVALVATVAACLVASSRCPALAIAAPLAGLAGALVVAPPSASRLRRVGIAIVVAAIGSCVVAVIGAR